VSVIPCFFKSSLIKNVKKYELEILLLVRSVTNSLDIKLYTSGTPNGQKVSVFLELLKVGYEVITVDIHKGEQKKEEFLAINPNGRIPVLVDENTNTTISESAAIITYLANTYDKDRKFSYEYNTPEYYKDLEITYFQMAGIGPMQGQAHHFSSFAPEKIPYGIERYTSETKRLYGVLEEYLKRNEANGPYLVGDHLSIADFVSAPWALYVKALGVDLKDYPLVAKWFKNYISIPEVKKGFWVPTAPRMWIEPEEL
jgi:glutathione S-transferase